jgi:hypothetical protein
VSYFGFVVVAAVLAGALAAGFVALAAGLGLASSAI